MNKKEIKNAITKEVCELVKSMGYEIHDDEGDGTILFVPVDYTTMDDTITWHRSYQETCTLNWASDKIKLDAEAIDAYMKPMIEYYNKQYQPKRVMA